MHFCTVAGRLLFKRLGCSYLQAGLASICETTATIIVITDIGCCIWPTTLILWRHVVQRLADIKTSSTKTAIESTGAWSLQDAAYSCRWPVTTDDGQLLLSLSLSRRPHDAARVRPAAALNSNAGTCTQLNPFYSNNTVAYVYSAITDTISSIWLYDDDTASVGGISHACVKCSVWL